jgi:hypothetical protein
MVEGRAGQSIYSHLAASFLDSVSVQTPAVRQPRMARAAQLSKEYLGPRYCRGKRNLAWWNKIKEYRIVTPVSGSTVQQEVAETVGNSYG